MAAEEVAVVEGLMVLEAGESSVAFFTCTNKLS